MPFVLLVGGARSGKSTLAMKMAKESGRPVTFIATAEARDDEMTERIARHRAERPRSWRTLEEPRALHDAVARGASDDFVILDCLTLWVSNLMEGGDSRDGILAAATEVATALAGREAPGVVITNEVGLGIVPDNELARRFRDVLGSVNSAFAGLADRCAFMVAGRIHELTAAADFMEGVKWPAPRPGSN